MNLLWGGGWFLNSRLKCDPAVSSSINETPFVRGCWFLSSLVTFDLAVPIFHKWNTCKRGGGCFLILWVKNKFDSIVLSFYQGKRL